MNRLKQAFAEKRPAIGLWQALANAYTAEICAGAGYDWLLFDGEHAPNTVQTLLSQLQAVAPFPVEPVARPPCADVAALKPYLDIGFRTLLLPMVDSAAQATAIVEATRFPPLGRRGVASSTSRASGFGQQKNYLRQSAQDLCLLMQIESAAALNEIDAIARVEGVDGLFIGPSDLAASLGHLGDPRHGDVRAAIEHALHRGLAAGMPVGIFALDLEDARMRLAEGFAFISAGTDIGVLSTHARALVDSLRAAP